MAERPENLTDREYASACTAAAADARMAGCRLPVMTVCGSGNQGITATVPVIAVANKKKYSKEMLYKALAFKLSGNGPCKRIYRKIVSFVRLRYGLLHRSLQRFDIYAGRYPGTD